MVGGRRGRGPGVRVPEARWCSPSGQCDPRVAGRHLADDREPREVADGRTYAISNFARDVLDIADNLQRALDANDDALTS